MPVHVSIHDVTAAKRHEVEAALKLCEAFGAKPALLVVPNFHGCAPLLDDPRFCEMLRGLQWSGHEVFLHGFFHRSAQRHDPLRVPGGQLRWLFAQRVVSGGEAEMSDVSADEGRSLVAQGEHVLTHAGLRVDGYVAPAWSMPAWLLAYLSERGYRFTEDRLRVYDPATGRSQVAAVLNWASRSPTRLISSVAWSRVAQRAGTLVPLRIAIHPSDMSFLLLRREICATLERARGDFVEKAADLFMQVPACTAADRSRTRAAPEPQHRRHNDQRCAQARDLAASGEAAKGLQSLKVGK
jgi:uncharacterized protein